MADDFQAIKEKIDIVTEIAKVSGGTIKKEGQTVRVNPCPLCGHKDCFTIYPEDQTWHCFSCNRSGDAFTFFQMKNNLTPKESLQFVAQLCGYNLLGNSPEERQNPSYDFSNSAIFDDASAYYHDRLYETTSPLNYLKNIRKHSDRVLKAFKIGYADGKLFPYLIERGYSHDEIEKSGLIKKKKGQWSDFFFEGLIIYPWFTRNNHIGSFSCKHPTLKQYKFRLQKEFSHPECHFFNMPAFRGDEILLVEGEDDLLTVHDRGGYHHAIGCMGQLSNEQIDCLKEWIDMSGKKTIYLCFDNDDAGAKYRDKIKQVMRPLCFSDKAIEINWKYKQLMKRNLGKSNNEEQGDNPDELIDTESIHDLRTEFTNRHLYEVETKIVKLRILNLNPQYKDIDDFLKSEDLPDQSLKKLIQGSHRVLMLLKQILSNVYNWSLQIKRNDVKCKVKPDMIGEILFDFFLITGNYFVDANDGTACKFFYKNQVYTIGNNPAFQSLIYREGGINYAQQHSKVIVSAWQSLAYDQGRKTRTPGWIHTDFQNNAIFFNLCNDRHEILKISPNNIEIVSNGINTDRLLLTSSPKMRPINYLPGTDIKKALAAFSDVLLANLACSNSDKYFIASFVLNTILIQFTKARGIRKYSGTHSSGKSSAAGFESMLIYGEDYVSSSTAAANYSEGTRSPLIIEDNLESNRMDGHTKEFIILAGTGVTRQKRKSGTDSENIYETLCTQVITTSIEPFIDDEIISRTVDFEFGEQYFNPDFLESIEAKKQIVEYRDMIWSAFFKIIACHILPGFKERRLKAIKMIKNEYPKHAKKRLNELYSCLYIICQELIKYIHLPYDAPNINRNYRNAKEVFDSWIATQDNIARDTTQETNPILYHLELLTNECMRIPDESFKEIYRIEGHKLYPNTQVETPIGIKIIASSRDLFLAFNIIAKNFGGKNPYKSVRVLSSRLKDSLKVLENDGWEYLHNERISKGYIKHSFTKFFQI